MIGNMAGGSLSAVLVLIARLICAALVAETAEAKNPAGTYLDLEPSLRSAALVVAVRVDDVSPVRVVYGGKNVQTLQQYTFTPVRVLKGVYSRAQLLMTSADLQPYAAYFDPGDLRSGQHRLLLLGRSTGGYYGIHPGSTADESSPELGGPDDPLLDASEAILALQDEDDRLAIVSRLTHDLRTAKARGAVVLLAALDRRRYVAAQHPPAFQAVAGRLSAKDAIVVEAAASVLGSLLDADYLTNESAREASVAALATSLLERDLPLEARTAALRAMVFATDAVRDNDDALRLVQLDAPHRTFAERAARLDILGRLHAAQGKAAGVADALAGLLADLPLDAPDYLQRSAAQAWARVAGAGAGPALSDRLRRKKSMGIEAVVEIEAFGLVLPETADAWAMQNALLENDLTTAESEAFVKACEKSASPRLVPALSAMLDPRHSFLRRQASDLLMQIGTEEAARALRPHLAEESELGYKLELAAFLGRRGFDDGYAYALEHMSDPRYREPAVQAVAAIGKQGSAEQLLHIYRTSNDPAWKHAALRALGLLRHESIGGELVELTRGLDHPLAAPALQARADLGDALVIELLPAALASRDGDVVIGAARAAGTLLPKSGDSESGTVQKIFAALRALARDAGAAPSIRRDALDALVVAQDAELARVLADMLRDRRLEDSDLLDRVRELMRERRARI